MAIKKLATNFKGGKRGPVQAAGGIVVRPGSTPHIAVVQMRKFGHWVLPKGKLNAGEDALTAARREVLEETGHQVSIHEYLGALSYEVRRGPKVVQFWRMQTTSSGPVRKLMRDIKAVRWLPLAEAIEILTHPREQAFLAQVGPDVLQASERATRRPKIAEKVTEKTPEVEAARPEPPPAAAPAPVELPQVEQPHVEQPRAEEPRANAGIASPRKSLLEKIRAWVHVKAE